MLWMKVILRVIGKWWKTWVKIKHTICQVTIFSGHNTCFTVITPVIVHFDHVITNYIKYYKVYLLDSVVLCCVQFFVVVESDA